MTGPNLNSRDSSDAHRTVAMGGLAFNTTHWSVVLAAGDCESPDSAAALEKLCRIYWYPLYAFVRRAGYQTEEAQDLTQAFFARFLERRDFAVVRPEKGRLRSFLLASLKHFLANEWQRAKAQKRGGGEKPAPLDEILAEERFDLEPRDGLTPELLYERRWALTVLDAVFENLRLEYAALGNARLYESLKSFLADDGEQRSQASVAAELEMSENALKQAFFRFRQRYRTLLREEIAHTVATTGEVDEEVRYLISVLRR